MLETRRIREEKEELLARLSKRGIDASSDIDSVLKLDEERRATQSEMDAQLEKLNKASKEIGQLFQEGKQEEANALKEEVAEIKESSKELTEKMREKDTELEQMLWKIPNAPHESVPAGVSEEDNEVVFTVDDIPQLVEGDVPHWDLTDKYGLIDFELGNKITGAGFPVYRGKGARLQRALIQFFLDEATEAGYEEVLPPFVVNEASGFGTGQLPDKEGQMYHVTEDDLYLIPTAEVPVTNIYRDVIVKEEELPQKLTAYTPCFRREAGSYGKDVRGLNRLHQFDKVEIVQIQTPDKSYDTLNEMLAHSEGLLKKLGLPYRILRLCGGDLGFTSALTFDLEVWSKAQERWLEVSSVSNFETFQANRLKLRMQDNNKKKMLPHTLNGSALALPRIVAALLENNQSSEGIAIPECLHKYTGFSIIA